MHLVQIDVVGAEPPQARLGAPNDVMPGCPRVVGPITHWQPCLSCDEHLIPIGAERLAQNLFG